MLNARALSDLLTSNRDGRLCKNWYLMTTNGTLLAYSHTDSITALRRQAALSAVTWQERESDASLAADPDPTDAPTTPTSRCVIVETEAGNTLIRALFQNLVLVLEGGVPPPRRRRGAGGPGSSGERRVTVDDGAGGAAYAPSWSASVSRDGTPNPGSSPVSVAGASSVGGVGDGGGGAAVGGSVAARVLRMQRVKLEALAEEVLREIKSQKFEMPSMADGEF